jgi:hypothetical protein
MAYAREVVGLTEQFWCPIKHARRVVHAHPHYHGFRRTTAMRKVTAEQLAVLRLQLQQPVARTGSGRRRCRSLDSLSPSGLD